MSGPDPATSPPALRARLFGAFGIAWPDGASALPPGRKARALLACLLLAGDQGLTRERLASLLWSRSAEEQARASLRQALSELRALTAGETPVVQVDRIGAKVVPGRVRTDLDVLVDAGRGDDASALTDAIGDELRELLSDLNGIDDSFDDWLRNERVRRGDERRAILLGVADAGLTAGDARGAQRLAAALLAADATDEAAARLAMRAGQASGDRDSVRQVFTRLEAALRSELDTAPSAETREVLRAATAEDAVHPPPTSTVSTIASSPAVRTDPAPPRRRAPLTTIAAATALVLAVSALWLWPRATGHAGPRLLLVRPLATADGDAAAQALAGGFATDLARMIVGNDASLAVVDPDSARGVAPQRHDLSITGDATTDAGTLLVDIKLRRAQEPTIVWSSSFARPVAEASVLREEIATKVAGVIVCGLGGPRPAPDDFDAQTLQLYLGACDQKYGNWAEAAKLLEQVVARRPDFAHGWAMLAAGTSTAAYFRPSQADELHRQALVHASHAIALDPSDGEAYFAQADAMPGIAHWAQRIAILAAGHAADPANASVNGSIGNELAKVGRWHEAIAAVQRAVDAEPFSPVHISALARLIAFGRSAESAEAALAVGRARFPLVGYFARTEFRVSALLGGPRRADAMLSDPRYRLTSSPAMTAAWKALIRARTEPTPANVELAVQAIRADTERPADLLPSIQKLMALNRVEDAYALAARLDEHADGPQDVLFSKLMAPFRADPRFMSVAARLGLVAIWQQTDQWPDFCTDKTLAYDCRTEAARAVSAGGSR